MEKKRFCRYVGRCLRISIFILNSIGWTVGILCIVGAMVVGFYSKTVKIDWAFDLYDLTLSTPCTIMFYYGVILGIVTISGCFAGSGGRWWSTSLYCLLLMTLALFDYYWGIRVFYKKTSLLDFLDDMESSMHFYGVEGEKPFGLIRRPINEYWDHIQQQNHCCGMYHWSDWNETPFGKKQNIPDSCCNERYAYPSCGRNLLHHPDNVDHQLMDVIHTKGCLQAYPRRFIWAFLEASIFGIILAVIFLISFLLNLILFLIVVSCSYHPGKPITEPTSGRTIRRTSLIPRHHQVHPRRQSNPGDESEKDELDDLPVTYDEFGRQWAPPPPKNTDLVV